MLSERERVHARLLRDLEAERVTHSGESHRELVRRLERERPLSPWQKRVREGKS